MNRRNAIMAAIAASLAPAAALPLSREDEKREILLKAASLNLSDKEQHEMMSLVMAVTPGGKVGNQPEPTLAELRSGMPITEVHGRAQARVNYALYGPEGAPIYENGHQVGGSRRKPFAWLDD
jgi:hypothetical protein